MGGGVPKCLPMRLANAQSIWLSEFYLAALFTSLIIRACDLKCLLCVVVGVCGSFVAYVLVYVFVTWCMVYGVCAGYIFTLST